MPRRILPVLPLALILTGYVVLGLLYAANTPIWQVPDEPAHYRVIQEIAASGCCPVMDTPDDYEDHQPPLYYLLQAPVYTATGGNVGALRAASVLWGAGAVIGVWAVGRIVFPSAYWVGLGMAAFVAFLPQRLFMMGGVNNDSLTETLAALTLALCAAYLRGSGRWRPPAWWFGPLAGLIFLTKLTIYPLTIVIALTVALRAWRERWPLVRFVQIGLVILIPAVLIGGVLWARNVATYGWPDFLAQAAHDRFALNSPQPETREWIAQKGVGGWLADMLQTTYQSFYGQFGWMSVPYPQGIYRGLVVMSVVSGLGAVLAALTGWRKRTRPHTDSLIMLGAAAGFTVLAFGYYNLKYVQFQGRYLYPALATGALLHAVGIGFWVGIAARGLPARRRGVAHIGAMATLAAAWAGFAVYSLYRVVIPFL